MLKLLRLFCFCYINELKIKEKLYCIDVLCFNFYIVLNNLYAFRLPESKGYMIYIAKHYEIF